MDITIPMTIIHPGGVIHTPFGDKTVPDTEEEVTVVLHIDDKTAEAIAGTLNP